MANKRSPNTAGFSLLEALVALVVISVSAKALLSAAEAHTSSVVSVSDRVVALWVAENTLVELQLGANDPEDRLRMAQTQWQVEAVLRPTGDPQLSRVDISVAPAADPDAPLAYLTGYVATDGGAS
ncbi:type II secretion system minor pseudopilin GspI [Candidatus Rhodobacter oscarellae]|nr:type II secretion system minor pseudopilin GspI [Candidatus Rhodobacter lobularis]